MEGRGEVSLVRDRGERKVNREEERKIKDKKGKCRKFWKWKR